MRPPESVAGLLKSGGTIPTRPPKPREARRPPPAGGDEPLPAEADLDWGEVPRARQDLSKTLPPDTALLKVVPARVDGEECFRLELYFRSRMLVTDAPETLKRQRRPAMMLAEVLDGEPNPAGAAECYTFLRNWSDTKYELNQWLTSLRREAGNDLRLVVWDDTDFGIPWELFWHATEENPGWLGIVIELTRWTTVHDPRRYNQFSAEAGSSGDGQVLYYEDSGLPRAMNFHFRGRRGYKAAHSMEELLAELAGPADYGLVYIRGHGAHSTDLFKATLAGVCLADFAGRSMPGLRRARTVVFLNACNSARPVINKNLGDEGNRNFAEVFLRQHAAGVIATMAEVPAGHSGSLARRLVTQARSDGVGVPKYLRAHRERYAKGLPRHTANLTAKEQSAIAAFLYASTFAYFGRPDATLKLADP